MFKIDKSVLNFKVGKWSQGRVGLHFATFRKLSAGFSAEEKIPAETEKPTRPLNKDVCALLEEAAFITGDRLGVKRRRLSKH